MSQSRYYISEHNPSYITRNKAWLFPLLAFAIIVITHLLLRDMFSTNEDGLSGISQVVFLLPSWFIAIVGVVALVLSGIGIMTTRTRSARILRVTVKILLLPVAVFGIWQTFFA